MKIIGTTERGYIVSLTSQEMCELTGENIASPGHYSSSGRTPKPGDTLKIHEAWKKLRIIKDVGSRVDRFARELRQIADDTVALAHHLPELLEDTDA